jgi:Fe-S cluster assembly iron-binding protein IscA
MLSITETAALAINSLIADSQMPEGSGLRIASQPDSDGTLALSVATAPAAQDTVVERAGATVFLEPIAAQALDQQVLDVQRVSQGDEDQYQFAITPQGSV